MFFVKYSTNLFSIRIVNNICPWHSIFNFLTHKNFFRPIWSVTFWKNIFIVQYSNKMANFKIWIFIINFFTRVNICVLFYISRFHFDCVMKCIIVFINYIIWFININISWNWSLVFMDFIFRGSNEPFSHNRFSSKNTFL